MTTDNSRRHKLLVATPVIGDGRFERTVILMIERGAAGAMGLVLNDPLDVAASDVLPQWADLVIDPDLLFSGGPVEPGVAVALATTSKNGELPGFTRLFGDLGVVDLGSDVAETGEAIDRMRVFSGYSGWSPGQLEAEIRGSGWFEVDAQVGDPFVDHPDLLWEKVLRRQGGKYLMYANYPHDPSRN